MQPQQPSTPNPNYDFILQGPKKKRLSMPSLNLPKPAKYAIVFLVGIMLLIILSSLLSGGSKSNSDITDLMAEQQEIIRVSTLAQGLSKDPSTQALTATLNTTIGSDKGQLSSYLGKAAPKATSKLLAKDLNSSVDVAFNDSIQKNNLESAIHSYFKQALVKYQTDLNTEFKKTKSAKLKIVMSSSYKSTQVILDSFPLKSS